MSENNPNFEMILMNAIKKCEGMFVEDISAKKFDLLYPFTTENITGYINYFNLSNQSLLTVGSSGDQIINSSLINCQDIVCIDICPYTKFYIYLKLSCLLELDKTKFLSFLCYKDYPKTFMNNKLAFDNNTYKKIKSTLRLLDYESYLMWDELFSNFNGLDIRKNLFNFDEDTVKAVIGYNPYLQSDIAYSKARAKIKKTKLDFITGDVLKIKIDRQFDSIWLSNIGTYISEHSLKKMIDNRSKNLNNNGLLLISYLYKTVINNKYQKDWSPIYNLEKTFEILQEYNPKIISFIGVDGVKFNDSTIKDSILVYRKSKH